MSMIGHQDRRRFKEFEEHLQDRLDLIRNAPRDRALEVLHLLLEAVYGEGFIRGAESHRVVMEESPILHED